MLRRNHGHHRGVRTPISASRAAPASTLIRDTGAVTRHGLRTPTSRADRSLVADPLSPRLPLIVHHPTQENGCSSWRYFFFIYLYFSGVVFSYIFFSSFFFF